MTHHLTIRSSNPVLDGATATIECADMKRIGRIPFREHVVRLEPRTPRKSTQNVNTWWADRTETERHQIMVEHLKNHS